MHPVEINEEFIRSRFQFYINQAPEPIEGEYQSAQDQANNETHNPDAWKMESEFIVGFICDCAPNWNIPTDQKIDLSKSIAGLASRFAPNGGMKNTDEWPPWMLFLYEVVNTLKYGVDMSTRELKPLKDEPVPESEETPHDEPRQKNGKFTTEVGE